MKGTFRFDSPVMQKLALLTNLMLLNLLWLICSLPVLTAGAATTAMDAVIFQYLDGGDDSVIKPFFKAFAANFRQSTLIGIPRDKLSRTFSSNSQKIHKKRCQKHRMAPDTSFDRLHFSVQQVFAEIRIVWQLVDIWLPAPLDFRQFQRIGFLQCMIVACHI